MNTSKWSAARPVRRRWIRAAEQEAEHVYELEREGESEWTPWITLGGVILVLVAAGLLMFGVIEGASQLLASASS
jgi:hypothetical protein